MQIENNLEYKEIPTSSLGLSVRTFNSLMRANISNLYRLIYNHEDLDSIRGLGSKSIDEIKGVLAHIAENGIEDISVTNVLSDSANDSDPNEELSSEESAYSLPDEILDRPAQDLRVPVRILHSFDREGIHTIREVLNLTPKDILLFNNMGKHSAEQLREQIELLKIHGADYFEQAQEFETDDSALNTTYGKGFDFGVIDILTEQFGMKPIQMTEWFGLSCQGIYNVLEKRSSKRSSVWTGKKMTELECTLLASMIQDRKFDYSDDTIICCCLNNRKDDLACLFIYEEEIKCFFLKDLAEDLREVIISNNYHRYTKNELSGDAEGSVVYILRKPYFLPAKPDRFRANAKLRGMSPNDYAIFLSSYPV